jgi:glycosyltransferase involved in cell wall biosynthesis
MDLTVVFLGSWHPAAEGLLAKGINPTFLGHGKWDPRALGSVLRHLDARPHDLLHLHSFKSILLGRVAARARHLPAVVHVHDHIPLREPLRFLQRRLGESTAALVAITDSVLEFAREMYRVPGERSHKLLYGIDLGPYLRAEASDGLRVREEIGASRDAPVLAVIGRINRDKGQDQVIRAMPRILDAVPRAELWVVGDGPQRAEFEALARELGLSASIRFLGQRSDIPAVLAAVQLTVLPSLWEEGFGLAALEALAAGRPVVAYRTGGVPEVVRDGVTGILVGVGEIPGLADAVVRLLSDPALRTRLGEAGRTHSGNFGLAAHVAGTVAIYGAAIRWFEAQG